MTIEGPSAMDREATEDALAELARLEQDTKLRAAETPERPRESAPVAYAEPAPRPAVSYQVPASGPLPQAPPPAPLFPQASPALGVPSLPKELRTLEDLYALYPDIGPAGSPYYLQIERIQPKLYMGQRVDGILGNLYERLSTEEFRSRYGGHEIVVHIIGPTQRGGDGQTVRSLNKVTLKFPDPPRFPESSMYQPGQPSLGGAPVYGPIDHPAVAAKRLELEAEERRALRQDARPAPEVVAAYAASSAETVRLAKDMADRQVAQYAHMINELQGRNRQIEERIQILQEEKTALSRELIQAQQYSETAQVKELKERHEREIRDQKEKHEREIRDQKERHDDILRTKTEEYFREKDRVTTEMRDRLETETRRHTEDRSKILDDAREQRDADRRTLTERMDTMRHDHEARVSQLRETYELQLRQSETARKEAIENIERNYRERLGDIKESHGQELRLLESNSNTKERVVSESTSMRVQLIGTELERARAEADELERELRRAQDKLHKEPTEYIKEAASVAKNLLGWKSPEEVKELEDGKKKVDWSELGATVAKTFAEKAPDIAKDIIAMRQQNQAARGQQPGMPPQQQQPGMPPQLPPHVVAAMQQEEQRRMAMAAANGQRQPAQPPPAGMPPMPSPPARRPGIQAAPPPWMAAQGSVRVVQAPPSVRPNGAVTMAPNSGPTVLPVTGVPNLGPQMTAPGADPFPRQRDPNIPMSSPTSPVPTSAPPAHHQPAQTAPVVREQHSAAVEVAQQPGAPPAQQTVAAPPGPLPPGAQIIVDPKLLGTFYEQLSAAIDHGESPERFAALVLSEIGPDNARQFLSQINADRVISTLEELSEQNPAIRDLSILTREGKRFTRSVFTECTRLVGLS